MRRPLLLFVLVTLVLGCEELRQSLDITSEKAEEAATERPPLVGKAVGLEAIRRRGELRLLTRNNATSYFVWQGRMMGFDYELGELFARQLGVELRIVVPPRWSEVLSKLELGEGDVAAASLGVTPERQTRVRFARPYTLTHMRLVWRKGTRPVRSPEGMSGKQVHVRRDSAYFSRLEQLSGLLSATGKPPVDIVIESEELETEQILEQVAHGRVPYTLCDYHICLVNKAYLPKLVIGPRVSEPVPLAWAVHEKAPHLAAEVDKFFTQIKQSGQFDKIYERYYETPRSAERHPNEAQARKKAISPFDTIFKAAERRVGIDWRLLAALAYQESHFEPKAGSWTRGKGLFGMLPAIGRELGYPDVNEPKSATAAAAKLLARLQVDFAGVVDANDRLKMTIAAFNCGMGHVRDARLLASNKGLNPDRWDAVARGLTLLARPKYAADAQHGYVRGSEVVAYVNHVWDRYRGYRHATGDRDVEQEEGGRTAASP